VAAPVAAALVVAPLVEGAEEEVDPETPGERREALAGRPVQGLGTAHLLGLGAEKVGVLGGRDETRAVAGGTLYQLAGDAPVLLLVVGRRQLEDRGEERWGSQLMSSFLSSRSIRLWT
jgi:hypothetical protein